MKKILKLILCLAIVAVLAIDSPTVHADQRSDLQNQIDQNNAMRSRFNKQAASLSNQIAIFDSQIKDAELQIQRTQDSIAANQVEIERLQGEINQKQAELDIQKENLYETMRVMYESPQQSTVEIVVGSNSLSEVVDRAQYIEALNYRIETTVNVITQLKADLENERNAQEKKKKDSEILLVEQQNYKKSLDDQRVAREQLLVETKGQESEYQRRVSELTKIFNEIYNSSRGAPVGSQLLSDIDGSWYYNQRDYPGVSLAPGAPLSLFGCLITSIAMVATKLGHNINPPGVVEASYFTDNGSWIGFSRNIGISVGASQPINWDTINSELNQGHPVIVSVYVGGTRYNSDGSNHFIVIKAISNDKYLIHDPYWRNSSYDEGNVMSMKIVRPN